MLVLNKTGFQVYVSDLWRCHKCRSYCNCLYRR